MSSGIGNGVIQGRGMCGFAPACILAALKALIAQETSLSADAVAAVRRMYAGSYTRGPTHPAPPFDNYLVSRTLEVYPHILTSSHPHTHTHTHTKETARGHAMLAKVTHTTHPYFCDAVLFWFRCYLCRRNLA